MLLITVIDGGGLPRPKWPSYRDALGNALAHGDWKYKMKKLKHRISQKKYADKHRQYYKNKNKIHNLKNKLNGYNTIKQQEYAKRYPKKQKARHYSRYHNLKEDHCTLCALFKNLNNQYGIYVKPFLGDETNVHFHHTDYIKNEGITLCPKHHMEEHMVT